ncbi:MAG TPA: alpha/beta hydrolase [Balneolaceae bacterium]|nr:alpha/beta hydrolase [Balneolaceae bacterium]
MSDIEILAYHGWGFDARCWNNWEMLMPDSIDWKSMDRGYFREPRSPEFSASTPTKIVFTHSFGLHQCSDEVTQKADILVIFSGFLRFHPTAAQFRRRSKQVVNQMIRQFQDEPLKVLKVFYRNVYHPQKTFELPREIRDTSLLLEDLKKLNTRERSLPSVKENANIFIFHGTDDAIVPKRKGRGLFDKFGNKAQYFEIQNSGHALPMTHAEKCWQMIQPEILHPVQ